MKVIEEALKERCRFVPGRTKLSKNSRDWYVSEPMFEEFGLGAIFVQMDNFSKMQCLIEIDPVFLPAEEHLRVINKASHFKRVIIRQGQSFLLLFESVGDGPEVSFPPSQHITIKLMI